MNRPRNRVLRFLLDALLIPLAVLIVLIEDVLWAGALRLLRGLSDLPALRAAQARVGRWPAAVALPLFLVPETLSHIAGAYSTLLLAQGRLLSAILVFTLVKGVCTLVLVWIYQACEATLLRVTWFAWLHHHALLARDWALALVAPLRASMRARLAALRVMLAPILGPARGSGARLRFRLRAWRVRLTTWLAGIRRG
jgi:hypothetical protein